MGSDSIDYLSCAATIWRTHVFPKRCVYRFLIRGAIENDAAGQFWNRPNTISRKRRALRCGSRLGNAPGLRIRWVSQISSHQSVKDQAALRT